jgi:hypothetical protein
LNDERCRRPSPTLLIPTRLLALTNTHRPVRSRPRPGPTHGHSASAQHQRTGDVSRPQRPAFRQVLVGRVRSASKTSHTSGSLRLPSRRAPCVSVRAIATTTARRPQLSFSTCPCQSLSWQSPLLPTRSSDRVRIAATRISTAFRTSPDLRDGDDSSDLLRARFHVECSSSGLPIAT